MLQQTNSKNFLPKVLAACLKKLEFIQVHQPTKQSKDWFDRHVCPWIGATPRTGQNKYAGPLWLEKAKFDITCHSVDYMIGQVCQGTPDTLRDLVIDPEEYIRHREDTVIVVLDETGLWLRLRGEEQVLLSFQEIYQAQRRKEIRKAIRLVQATEDLASKKQLEQKVQEYMDNECISEKSRDMVSQFYHSGGDKHRLNRRLKFICSKVLFSKLPSPSPSKMTCSVLITVSLKT